MRLWSLRKIPALRRVVGLLAVALLALWTTAEVVHGRFHRSVDGAPALHTAGAVSAASGCSVCDFDAAGTAPIAHAPAFWTPCSPLAAPALPIAPPAAVAASPTRPRGRAPPV